jgi:hypothetical protein
MASNMVGTATSTSLLVRRHEPSVVYDLRYGIPAVVLLALWFPSFLVGALMFATRKLRFSYIRNVLNDTSTGRILLCDSGLKIKNASMPSRDISEEQGGSPDSPADLEKGRSGVSHDVAHDGVRTPGQTLIEYVREK